jgi:hypothetical protein
MPRPRNAQGRFIRNILRDSFEALQRLQGQLSPNHEAEEEEEGSSHSEVSEEQSDHETNNDTMTTVPPSNVQLPKQPQCETPAEIEGFIKKYTVYVRLAQLSPEDALERFAFSLKGQVDLDYQTYWHNTSPTSLEEAFESLRLTCGGTRLPFNRWVMQFSLEQKQGETVDGYLTRFRQEQIKAQGDTNEGMLVQLFIKSLLPRISTKVFDSDPPNLRQAIEEARKAEQSVNFQEERWKRDKTTRNIPMVPRRIPGPNTVQVAPGQNLGGAFRRIAPPGQMVPRNNSRKAIMPTTTAQEKQEDPEIEQLRQQLVNLTLGSVQHQQVKEQAMQSGRCLICLSKRHLARQCPQKPLPAFAITDLEKEDESEEEGIWVDYEEESDPEWAQ